MSEEVTTTVSTLPTVSQPAPQRGAVGAQHYKNKRLTREGMLHVVRNGGSVTHKGMIINTEAALPSEADLAIDSPDPAAVSIARNNLRAQLDLVSRQLNDLEAANKQVGTSDAEANDTDDDLDDLKKEELLQRAHDLQLQVTDKSTRAEIILAIRSKMSPAK